ncbi:MAG: gamma-glutamyltransferase [Mesorhizobium sp.]|nr:MAG: gamma-glutamyltransferase [Mesorhizobium sp.]
MVKTPRATRGMVTTPHHLASQSGLAQLRAGRSAIAAVVAAAATLAVVYPHMSGLGGDGFWLISEPGREPFGIQAAGRSGQAVDTNLYERRGLSSIPARGPLAANTVAGTVDGWRRALEVNEEWGERADLEPLLEDAIFHAENGAFVTRSQEALTREGYDELVDVPGFASAFLTSGQCPRQGEKIKYPALGETFRGLARHGLADFYQGRLATEIAADLSTVGSPLTAGDLADHSGAACDLLSVDLPGVRVFNHQPPTQGLASLMILALMQRLEIPQADGFAHIHAAVEATKLAFSHRNRIGDPESMQIKPAALLDRAYLDSLATRIDARKAQPWETYPAKGDTVWLGAIDGEGRAVSYIQSIYYDFGSGVVLPQTGILWQNRGVSFRLDGIGPRALEPRRLPFHTLNPAFAQFEDGRRLVYGTMGGDGQPQTLAAIFSRYAMFGQGLQEAVSAPRWLLGRRWADEGASLKLEDGFSPQAVDELRTAGHDVELIESHSDLMGHAGAIVLHADGLLEGAADPRSDGAVAAW